MIDIYLFEPPAKPMDWVDGGAAVAIATLLEHWNEEPAGPQTFLLLGDDRHVIAVLMRDCIDNEVCHVAWSNGQKRSFRCHYALDDEDRYLCTQVTDLGELYVTDLSILEDKTILARWMAEHGPQVPPASKTPMAGQ